MGSAWCPNLTKINVMTLTVDPHVHEHTPMAFCITAQSITIMDFRCGMAKKKRFTPNLSRTDVSSAQWNSLFYPDVAGESDSAVPNKTPIVADTMIIDTFSVGLAGDELPPEVVPGQVNHGHGEPRSPAPQADLPISIV